MTEYDLVVIGSGHNGMICAAYLAKAGAKVLVLERQNSIGGFTTTQELRPGYRCNTHSTIHSWIAAGPVYRDLELPKWGYEVLSSDPQYGVVFSDGSSLVLYEDVDRTCQQIAKLSPRDAKAYKEFYEEFKGFSALGLSIMFRPPSPLGQIFAPLEESEKGARLVKILLSSSNDIANELFSDDRVKILPMHLATQGANHPDTKGTGMVFLIFFVAAHAGARWGLAKGGSINLPLALQRFIEAHGGKVIAGKPVKKILTEGNRAIGIETQDGEKIMAKNGVVSACGTPNTVLNLLGEEHLPGETTLAAKRYRWDSNTSYYIFTATKEPYRYKAAEKNPDIDKCYLVGMGADTLAELQEEYDAIKENRLPEKPWGVIQHITKLDPSCAPQGRNLQQYWGLCCYELDGDVKNWDKRREEILEWELWHPEGRTKYIKNLNKENLVDAWTYTAYDWDAPQQKRGSMMLGDASLDQIFAYRPWFGASNYKLPEIERLYLSDGTCHPFGAVSGAPGYNAANAIADDLKLNKWW